MGEFGIGQPVPREEDPYLVRGAGHYVDDFSAPGLTRGYVLRSPHAAARILTINAEAARLMPGVHLVLTGHDKEVEELGTQHPVRPYKRPDGTPAKGTPQFLLARDRVRYVGDPVAFIVADTLNEAKDAAEAIEIEYEMLPSVTSLQEAVKPGAPAVSDEYPDNQVFLFQVGDRAATDAAFAGAAHVVRHRMVISRITTNSMEPRGCLAEYEPREQRYIVRCTLQGPHATRRILASEIFHVPETKFRVISGNVGGGFGMKGGVYPEYGLCALAARLTGRPVKWISERSEGLMSDEHCRDNVTEAELALDNNGRFLAMRTRTFGNIGAYYNSDRSSGPMINNIGVLAGTYLTPAMHAEVIGVVTNTALTGPYRGAGRPEAAYVTETMVELAAKKLGIDSAELRRRNTIPPSAMPFKTALVYNYDCGDFARNLDDALKMADSAGFEKRRAESKKRGKLRGFGFSNTVEASNAGLIEHAEIRFDPTGTVTVSVGTHDHGQGHATTFRQIISSRFGITPDKIHFRYGDTDQVTIGTGTFGSRSTAVGGTAMLMAAQKIIDKGTRIAAHLMEAGEHDIVFEDGKFTVAGTDKSIGLVELARKSFLPANLPKGMEPGLFDHGTFDGGDRTYPNGCHVCEVEIDEETGEYEIVRYSAVDDVGNMINPLLVEGQVHGGVVQGLGQAFMEEIIYDSSGQLVTGSFMDYQMPRAADFPTFKLGENVVPTKTNPLGVKGAGESGTVGALAAAMNAINHALEPIGADYFQMPATPQRLWAAIQAAKRKSGAAA